MIAVKALSLVVDQPLFGVGESLRKREITRPYSRFKSTTLRNSVATCSMPSTTF